MRLDHIQISSFPHSSFSPPFHHATTCPTSTGRMRWSARRSSDRKRAQSASRRKNVSIFKSERSAGLGFSKGESPQKIGRWGAKRVYERETKLTISALSLPQFTHMHSSIFFTSTMKPGRNVSGSSIAKQRVAYQDGKQALPAQYVQSDLGTQTYPPHTSDT